MLDRLESVSEGLSLADAVEVVRYHDHVRHHTQLTHARLDGLLDPPGAQL